MSTLTPVGIADAHVHRLYGEYSGLPVGVVTQCVQQASALQQLIWSACPGDDWADKARAFHERHEEAVFGLMQRTASRAQRRVEHEQSGLAGQLAGAGDDVLDFGGGLGFTASLLRDAGKRVTYVDVDGPALAFARWYFERCDHGDVELCKTSSAIAELPAGRQWDLVLAERVLECVPDPVATVERLAGAVRSGGMLFVVLDGGAGSLGRSLRHPRAARGCRKREAPGDKRSLPLFGNRGAVAAGAAMGGPSRRVDIANLVAGSPTLRHMRQTLAGDDGRHAFRAG